MVRKSQRGNITAAHDGCNEADKLYSVSCPRPGCNKVEKVPDRCGKIEYELG